MSATGEGGFTLIEMLVVLAIAGLIGGIGWPRLQSALGRAEARATVSGVAAALRRTRADARLRGVPVAFTLSRDSYGPAGQPIAAAASVRLDGSPRIVFYPDGTSSGGDVGVAGRGFATRFEVARTTGLARVR